MRKKIDDLKFWMLRKLLVWFGNKAMDQHMAARIDLPNNYGNTLYIVLMLEPYPDTTDASYYDWNFKKKS